MIKIVDHVRLIACLLAVMIQGTAFSEELVPAAEFKILKDVQLGSTSDYKQRYVSIQSQRGASTGVLILEPADPVGNVILFAGGDGKIFINEDGTIEKGRNFLVRSRDLFAAQSMRTVVIQPPSDHTHLLESRTSKWHMQDIASIVSYLASLSSHPVWLVGTSRGTISVAAAGQQVPEGLAGIVLTSSVTEHNNHDSVYTADVSAIMLPVLVVHHEQDDCWVTPYSGAEVLVKDLERASRLELISFSGGLGGSDECGAISSHGFNGIESDVVNAIVTWITSTGP